MTPMYVTIPTALGFLLLYLWAIHHLVVTGFLDNWLRIGIDERVSEELADDRTIVLRLHRDCVFTFFPNMGLWSRMATSWSKGDRIFWITCFGFWYEVGYRIPILNGPSSEY